jgi:large subunit ribosomal protein L13
MLALCTQRLPERIVENAVKGMLPKGRLGRDIRLHLKVTVDDRQRPAVPSLQAAVPMMNQASCHAFLDPSGES